MLIIFVRNREEDKIKEIKRLKKRRDREHEKRAAVMAERRSRKIDESKETAHDNI